MLVNLFAGEAGSQTPAVFDEVHTLSRAASAAERAFEIQDDGDYEVTLTDNAFPAAFDSLTLIVTRGTQIVATVAAPGNTVRFAASAGTHRVHVVGTPTTAAGSGSFGVKVVPAGGATPVLQFAAAINLPPAPSNPDVTVFEHTFTVAADGDCQVTLSDFAFPVALESLSFNIVRVGGASVFATPPGPPAAPGGPYTFNATAGDYKLIVIAEVDAAAGSGIYSAQITQGAQTLYSQVQSVNTQTEEGAPGYTFETDVPAAGTYRVTLTDFQFRVAFQSLSLNVTQSGASLGTLSAPAPFADIAVPAAGRVFVSVIARPASSTDNGLFGLRLEPVGGGAGPLIDVTQGVGPLFDVRTVTIDSAGSYDVTLSDVGFPTPFTDISLAVTRGTDRVGSIIAGGGGSGKFSFPATPGAYLLNFIAVPSLATHAGTYGLQVSPSPPAPTVTLNANPVIVRSGEATTLNWATTDATACQASGAWSGNKSTQGSQATAALTANSTFTLTCTGAGGTASGSVTVNLSSERRSGGGGVLDLWALLTWALLLAHRRRTLSG